MSTLTFDTLAYVKTLRDAGIEERQAEAQATALATVLKGHSDELATKADMRDMKRDMDVMKAEFKKDLADTKAELIRWVVGIGFLQSALIIGVLAKIAKVI